MPQDIPVEASETLVFTPECLASVAGAPTFTLRAGTRREARFRSRLMIEEGIRYHSNDAIRREVRTGLAQLWDEETCAEQLPVIEAYWDAVDAHNALAQTDPDAKFEYDEDVERAVGALTKRVTEAWRPLRTMMADNAEFNTLLLPLLVAVIVQDWTGLDVKRRVDRGFLTFECAQQLCDALGDLASRELGPAALMAQTELLIACTRRMKLDEDEAKNSASPSPSAPSPAASNPMNTSEQAGSSPESTAAASKAETQEPSGKTPATA